MKTWKTFALCAACLAALAFTVPDIADAARLGGGRSFGSSSIMKRPVAPRTGSFGSSGLSRQTAPMQSSRADGGAAAPAADGAVTLTIWQPTDTANIEAWWVEKIDEWNAEHPELQVHREAIDRSDSYAYENKITTAVTSDDLPDILFVDGPQVSYYAANGIIVPISEYFSDFPRLFA